MKIRSIQFVVLLFILSARAFAGDEVIYAQLDHLLEQKQELVQLKQKRIAALNQELKDGEKRRETHFQYQLCNKLFEEYKSFQYDSAYKYTSRMLSLAYDLKDKGKINNSKVNVSFIFLSSGMFKEALDTLVTVDSLALKVPERINFYKVFARTYYDLSDFSQNQHFNEYYNAIGNKYLQQALNLCQKASVEFLFIKGWEFMRLRNIEQGIATYENLLKHTKLPEHAYAIVTSSLSYMYRLDGNEAKTKEFLINAAMADLRASVFEAVALRDLAEMLYKENHYERAYRYIKIASDDAYAYGAKFRQVQTGYLVPKIEAAHMIEVEGKRRNLLIYSLLATVLSLVIFILYYSIYRNNRKLKLAKASLIESHRHLEDLNGKLQELNHNLLDANKIKEEYIGHFFKTMSEYIDKIDKIKVSIDRKISLNRMDQIQIIVNQINLKAEREALYGSFDRIFLEIFPDFVSKFNTFITEEEKYVFEPNDPLPPELRIFALIRLGITDNEKIAQFLRYSINTIYTYKTRLKNKTVVPNDKLELRVMEIKAN